MIDPPCSGILSNKNEVRCEAWWCIPVIPALRKLRQKDCEFKARLGYIEKKMRQGAGGPSLSDIEYAAMQAPTSRCQ
jgi:hypothetical protein